jgi:hypothetical protein
MSSSYSYICPNCGKSVSVKTLPIGDCPHCGKTPPSEIVREIENNFEPSRPISITVQMYFGFIFGAIMAIAIPDAFKPVDTETYRLVRETLHIDFPDPPKINPMITGCLCIVKVITLFWSSYSIFLNEYRSRDLLMVMVFALLIPESVFSAMADTSSPIGRMMFISSAVASLVTLVLSYLYLYKWKYSVQYYDNLRYLEDKAHAKDDEADDPE